VTGDYSASSEEDIRRDAKNGNAAATQEYGRRHGERKWTAENAFTISQIFGINAFVDADGGISNNTLAHSYTRVNGVINGERTYLNSYKVFDAINNSNGGGDVIEANSAVGVLRLLPIAIEGLVELGIITGVAATILHGNNKQSKKPNIVYEIWSFNVLSGEFQTKKYGVSSRRDFIRRNGNPRPEYQVVGLNAFEFTYGSGTELYGYNILYRTSTREEALELEKTLVRLHRRVYGPTSLPLQKLPK
ncbi:MAG: hypothetical protein ABJH72_08715, partial [Reichenbachiella sp.]